MDNTFEIEKNTSIFNYYLVELGIRTIKVFDIIYVTLIYFFLGYYLAIGLDKAFYNVFGTPENKSKYLVMLEVVLQISTTGILIYISRNIVPFIPFPLNNVIGYDHILLKELHSASVLSTAIITFQKTLSQKLNYIKEHTNNDVKIEKKLT